MLSNSRQISAEKPISPGEANISLGYLAQPHPAPPPSSTHLAEAMGVQTIAELGSLLNKTVLLRVDANVSAESTHFYHHPRAKQVAATLARLSAAGARTIVLSHRSLGEDTSSAKASNHEIVQRLKASFPSLAPYLTFHAARENERDRTMCAERAYFRRLHMLFKELPAGHAIFLENTRLFPSEREERTRGRLKLLANAVDYVVYDGFGVGHRGGQLSVDGIIRDLTFERKCLGPAAMTEWEQVLSFAKTAAPQATALVLGGDIDKFESKLNLVIEILKSDRVGLVYLGGVFGTSWLHVHGCALGRTPVSRNARALEKLRSIADTFHHVRFELPFAYVGLTPSKELCRWQISSKRGASQHVHLPDGAIALDQPESDLSPLLEKRGISQVIAVGPLGFYSMKPFHEGTVGTYRLLAKWAQAKEERKLLVGGGNSVEALLDMPDFREPRAPSVMVSSGGGALLNAVAEAFKVRGDPSLVQTPTIRALRRSRR